MVEEISIYKLSKTTWNVCTSEDSILVILHDGIVHFYRQVKDVSDIS